MNQSASSGSARAGSRRRRLVLAAAAVVLSLVAAAVAGGVWLRAEVRGSLPQLDGEWSGPGPRAVVKVSRDALGVPRIEARTDADAFFALGFLHGQDRFFQMDLSRRSAAGELAELFGEVALPRDRQARLFGFRGRAKRALERLEPAHRRLLSRYAEGVNAGLNALDSPPFEYLMLRTEPRPWRPQDSLLVVFSMYDQLQDGDGRLERERATLLERLPRPLADFLWPSGGSWDAAVDGSTASPAPVPGPEVIDLRRSEVTPGQSASGTLPGGVTGPPRPRSAVFAGDEEGGAAPEPVHGSNAWAVSGERRGGGPALVANDMHLPLSLPNTWYRARLRVSAEGDGGRTGFDATGATLPGVPAVIVGSNRRVAWGLTNSYADTTDLVVVEVDPEDEQRYRVPGGWRRFDERRERIEVDGSEAVELKVRNTIWGPVVARDAAGRPLAARWVALTPEAVDLGLLGLLRAGTVEEAVEVARDSSMPAQNVILGDVDGSIAWTIAGRLPERIGFDGSVPVSWADGSRGWDGLVDPEKVPAIVDPAGGLLWNGNHRMVGGRALEILGDGGYALGARGRQIRDRLRELKRFDEEAMLEVQRDDRAEFLTRWRRLLLDVLEGPEARGRPKLERARAFVEDWGGRASVDSVGYRLVRGFRLMAASAALDPLLEPCREEPGALRGLPGRQWEYPLWALVTERPEHLLDPAFDSWEQLLLDTADRLVEQLTRGGAALEGKTWGARNVVHLQHPLSRAVPWIGRWIDLPPRSLSGDRDMPLVQAPSFGASQRLAVAPGRESDAIFHMPGGQSGHPASPYYGAGHRAWERRVPAPLLPGPAEHELVLRPAR